MGVQPGKLAFIVVVLLCASSSGGIIVGVGPFLHKMVQEKFFYDRCAPGEEVGCDDQYNAISPIFTGAFQMMTWVSCVAGILLDTIGPRYTAAIGMVMAICGNYLLSNATTEDGVYLFMVAYGLIGSGGNGMYISSFHFANLFEDIGLPCSILAGAFNISGLVLMLLNIPSVTIHNFFQVNFYWTIFGLLVTLIFYPDRPYQLGDKFKISFPSLSCKKREPVEDNKALLDSKERGPVGLSFLHSLGLRFFVFIFIFAYSTMVSVVLQGILNNLSSSRSDNDSLVSAFQNYIFPFICNATIFLNPFIGSYIDKHGFWKSELCLASVSLIAISTCFIPSIYALFFTLVFICAINSFAYTLEFSYLQMTYPPVLYGRLVALTIATQGTLGFIAWPGLSPNPFGAGNFTPLLLIILCPAPLMFFAPYVQWKYEKTQSNLSHNRFRSLSVGSVHSLTGQIDFEVRTSNDYEKQDSSKKPLLSSIQ